jgi:hypothetical protein
LRRERDPRHEKGEHSEESRGNAREESAASIGSIRRSPVTSLSVAIGTSQAKIRSLLDEAELPAKLRVEGPNHRVPLGDRPNLPCECEPRMKPQGEPEFQKLFPEKRGAS